MAQLIVKEDSVALLSGKLLDEGGDPITSSRLTALRMWLYDASGNIINSRDDVDILNANGGTVDGDGNFLLRLTAADNPILDDDSSFEEHTLLVFKVWDVGNPQQDWDEIELVVRNLSRVPVS